jgi:hypothetical protein
MQHSGRGEMKWIRPTSSFKTAILIKISFMVYVVYLRCLVIIRLVDKFLPFPISIYSYPFVPYIYKVLKPKFDLDNLIVECRYM